MRGKKRQKSHRSPDPTAKRSQPRETQPTRRQGGFPIWGTAFLAANLAMLLQGGAVPTALAVGGCALDVAVLKKTISGGKKFLYCVLILGGMWAALLLLTLMYQKIYS